MSGQRMGIVSKSEVLVLRRPNSRRNPFIYVRVSVERGEFFIQSQERRCMFRKRRVDALYDLKVVWVNDLPDDQNGRVKNCFVVVTPEASYILQANTHRVKIEWMQSLSIAISQTLRFRGSYRPRSWTNLDALQKWLTVRDVQYRYETDELYKGAVYRGKWNMGMPHVCGSMKWSNGDSYDGEFRFGKFHGSGTMLWLSDRSKRSYTGEWVDGKMEGYGEMTYADHSIYTGWWHLGKRHGHGRMEDQVTGSSYIGAWEADMRSGYGVFDDTITDERYLGMWEENKYHGPGILVSENRLFYSGMFANGERSVAPEQRRLVQDEKWVPLFRICRAMLEQMVNFSHSLGDITHPSTPQQASSRGASNDSDIQQADSGLDVSGEEDIIQVCSPDLDKSCQACHTGMRGTDECVVCRVEGFKSAEHPFGILVNNLTKCFNASYSGTGCHMYLLPHATGELHSITTRIHQLVSELCPSVISSDEDDLLGRPRSQLTLLLKHKHKRTSMISQSSQGWCDPTWLYPILLPSIFPTLFDLYKAHYVEQDERTRQLMESLSRESDEELCHLLCLDSEYKQWEERYGLHGDGRSTPADRASFSLMFQEAVEIFRNVSGYLTPMNKLLCIQEANAAITQTWRSLRPLDSPAAMSPLSPCSDTSQTTSTSLMAYLIIKSHVPNLFSEIQYTQDFAGKTLLTEEYGFLLSLLKDSHRQVDSISLWNSRAATPGMSTPYL